MNKIHYMSVALLLLLITSCSSRGTTDKEFRTVKIDTVSAAGQESTLQYPGKVKAAQDVSLAFRVSGTIQRFLVDEGSKVQRGQLLAELDPTDYQIQLDATEAEYQEVKAQADRVIALYQDNGTTPAANDKAVYGLKQITAKRKHHQDQLAYTRLYAPFSGIVQKRLFDSHETVGAGMPVVTIISNGTPEIEINLPAAEYIRREAFQSYHCTFDIYPGHTYPLKFISVTPKANSNQLYTMRLQLEAQRLPMPSPGMNTMVTIGYKSQHSQELSVKTTALLEQNGKTYVYIYHPNQHNITLCEVQPIRLLSDGRTLITSNELKAEDLVVASGVHVLKAGETVEPIPTASTTNVGGLL